MVPGFQEILVIKIILSKTVNVYAKHNRINIEILLKYAISAQDTTQDKAKQMDLQALMPHISTMIPYAYEKIKNAEYEKVISEILTSATQTAQPYFVQIGGIPGAGKSTFCKQHKDKSAIYISFDKIMENLHGYQKDLQTLGSIEAFKRWELPARVIGYEVLRRAIEKKINIRLEHSGVNEAHIELFKSLKKLGFKTEVDFILCQEDIAYQRTLEREQRTQRHTPKSLIEERSAKVKEYLPKYKSIADTLNVYDSSHNHFNKINF